MSEVAAAALVAGARVCLDGGVGTVEVLS